MEILKLTLVGKDYFRGGIRLRDEYEKTIDMTAIGGDVGMLCSSRRTKYSGKCIYKGVTLTEVLKRNPEYLGNKCKNGELPIWER